MLELVKYNLASMAFVLLLTSYFLLLTPNYFFSKCQCEYGVAVNDVDDSQCDVHSRYGE